MTQELQAVGCNSQLVQQGLLGEGVLGQRLSHSRVLAQQASKLVGIPVHRRCDCAQLSAVQGTYGSAACEVEASSSTRKRARAGMDGMCDVSLVSTTTHKLCSGPLVRLLELGMVLQGLPAVDVRSRRTSAMAHAYRTSSVSVCSGARCAVRQSQ
jgi:hypothetical protein